MGNEVLFKKWGRFSKVGAAEGDKEDEPSLEPPEMRLRRKTGGVDGMKGASPCTFFLVPMIQNEYLYICMLVQNL